MVTAVTSRPPTHLLKISDTADYVNVTWNIAFSGRTPSKLMATHTLEQVFLAQIPLMRADDTYHARQKTQKDFERLSEVSFILSNQC